MIRPSKIVRAVNWWHAAGELVLIVAGILIALAISDWNDRRLQREQEHALLSEIRYALVTDLKSLEDNLLTFSQAAIQIEQLSVLLKDKPDYNPSMDRLFGVVYGIRSTNLNFSAYETLKSMGLQSVSNRELRQGIARVYDHHYERVLIENNIDLLVNVDLMRDYYIKNFRDLQFWRSATPLDYAFVVNDPYFQNIVDYRLEVLRSNALDSYPQTIAEIRGVLELLEKELEP